MELSADVYRFHLKGTGWWAGLIDLWLGVSNHSQFKMGRLGHIVSWCPVVKPSVASQEFFLKGE